MSRSYEHWIDGDWKAAARSGAQIDRISPAHGELVASFAAGDDADLRYAVSVAHRTFESGVWSDLAGSARAAVLQSWADLIETGIEYLATIEAEESGKPIRFARGEISHAVSVIRYAAALAWQIKGEAWTDLGPQIVGLALRQPIGVVGMIIPWNFPLVCLIQKLPFALAAGCTAVIKPSELTSGTALEVAALASKAGLPAGVINVVTGEGNTVGEALSTHPDIALISFTGSTSVGKRVARHAADRIGRVALELGGKGANVVFADADLDAALDGVLFGIMLNQGEECCAGSRLIIERDIAADFTKALSERAAKLRVGMPLDEATDIGPMINEQHLDRVLEHVQAGRAEGATCIFGGERMRAGDLGKGAFVGTTIFDEVTPRMSIFQNEIFGPVLTVTTFQEVEEAVALANDTPYGLANGLWSKNLDKVFDVNRRLQSGNVYVNTFLESALQLPFGGMKQSGLGREMGMEGLHEFTELKSTFIKLGARTPALPHTL